MQPMFNRGEYATYRKYVRHIADQLGLRDWTINTTQVPCDEERAGTCETVYGRKHATVMVCAGFRQLTPEAQRSTIVHELLHCNTAQIRETFRQLDKHLGMPAYQALWIGFDLALEYCVDGMADEWARHLPLIDWPKARTPKG